MSKFAMKWARKTDVPLYYEMIDPVLTVDDGCFPSLEFTIEAKYGSTVPSVGNDDVLEKFDLDQWKVDQESITKTYGKVKEEEMKINYGIKANANTARKFEYSDPFLEQIVKERKEQHKKETRDLLFEANDSYIRRHPYIIVRDKLELEDDVNTIWKQEDIGITRVKIDDPWVIMFWSDKTVTKAKCDELDSFDPEVGIMICICKKLFRTPQNLRKILKNLTKDYYKEFEEDSDITFNGLKENLKDAFEKLAKVKEEADGTDNK